MAQSLPKVKDKDSGKPQSVRVFGRVYYFLYNSYLENGMTNLGLTHLEEGIVNIRSEQHPVEEKDTLLHETLHIIDEITGSELTEKQITVMAHGIIGMFQDNPEFAEYILKKVDV